MNIFNRKRVEELEQELLNVKCENNKLRDALDTAYKDITNILKLKNEIPEDCTPGRYCVVCDFSKKYNYRIYSPGYGLLADHDYDKVGYICNKANICKNFSQKQNLAK